MRKILLAVAVFLLFALPCLGATPDIQDVTIYPVQSDLTAGAATQYSAIVTAAATDTNAVIVMDFDPLMRGYITWGYVDIDFYLKGTATSDVFFRFDGRNVGEDYWRILNEDFIITSSNDVLKITTAGGGTENIDTADGTYTGTTLAVAMQTAIRAGSTIAITSATVVYDTTAQKFTFDGVTDTIALTFADSDMATTVGFGADLSAATEQTSSVAVPAYYDDDIGTSYVQKNYSGYLRLTDGWLDSVPFQIRCVFQSNEANGAVGRYGDDTFIRAIFKEAAK